MSIDVKPGSKVSVKVTTCPTNQAAAKTLSRVFGSDASNRKKRQARKKLRAYGSERRTRGGRLWAVLPKAPRLVIPKKGDSCQIFATSSLINDLRSVSRFVEVETAN